MRPRLALSRDPVGTDASGVSSLADELCMDDTQETHEIDPMIVELLENLKEINPEALVLPGYDHAIMGTVSRCGFTPVLCYDSEEIIATLVDRDGMEHEEAVEFFEFNILGAYHGEGTPMYLNY
jgi:hypothetical protein